MTTKKPPVETAVTPKKVIVATSVIATAIFTTTYVLTTSATAPKLKIVTTNPAVGKAKY